MPRLQILVALVLAVAAAAADPAAWDCSFDESTTLPAGWSVEGTVAVVAKDAFKGPNALVLARAAAEREQPCSATGPAFPIAAGTWEVSCAAASELESPDASFKGVVAIETLDAAGKVLDRSEFAEPYGTRPWQIARKRIAVPATATTARFTCRLDKTIGRFRVDSLMAKPVADARKPSAVDRIVFSSAQLGNLFHPEDPKVITITVASTRALTDAERTLTWSVCDYWGAEQAAPATVVLADQGTDKERHQYKAEVDLAAIPLQTGRYYEIRGVVPLADNDPYRNFSGFAILPTAASKAYKPAQIPFTSRTWDNRIGDYQRLVDRLGVRILGIWGDSGIDTAAKQDQGILTGAPGGSYAIEHHQNGYEKWTEETMRADVRAWFAKNGKHQPGPIVIDLGNEPNNTGDRLKEAVRAYKIVYDEIKKVAPDTIVVGTSIGATDEYFQLGYQDACDVFDFHVYESPLNIRAAIAQYQEMMRKYHCEKPIWSTEIGLNSQGMTRQYIAADLARKCAAFFAAGGANFSWFGYLYPDPDAKIYGSGADAFNMFDSRYCTYGPRLDAIMHYQLLNGMLVKKFVNERTWKDGLNGCLFRDGDGQCFAILWKDRGSADVQLPLPGVKQVRCQRIDGRECLLDASAGGIGLSIGEDPLLLTYAGPATLPEALGEPALRIAKAPARLVRGVAEVIELAGTADPQRVSVIAPPGWLVERVAGAPLRFSIASPEVSQARAGDLIVHLAGADGSIVAELAARPDIAGRLGVEIRPVPAARAGGQPAAAVVVRNLSAKPQTVAWTFAITAEQVMEKGEFAAPRPTTAFLAEDGGGSLTVPAGGQASVDVPLAGIDPIRLYHATATITDAEGGSIASSRVLGGFAAVPRAGTVTVDGVLDEAAWAKATVCPLDQADQYFGFHQLEWKGVQDLSARLRFLWDDRCLYVGVQVTDDVFANTKSGGDIWAGDGLQFLFDPKRDQAEKPGKYDAGFAVGSKGPQAWYWLTASQSVPAGLQPDITVAMKRGEDGDATYEVAIPWAKLAPFEPGPGADFGACMIVNEDDGPGRKSFIGWFGNPHTKQIDTAGDLILMDK